MKGFQKPTNKYEKSNNKRGISIVDW